MRTAVFLGPSLPHFLAKEILPGDYYPPARQGDLLWAVREGYDTLVLIDGEDYASGPLVWHKEILHALRRGLRVVGSSGIGAIRAAELCPFGMEGVGEIFRLYREGILERDDAVAAPFRFCRDQGEWIRLGEPLVNVQSTLEKCEFRGELSKEEKNALHEIARSLHYKERSFESLLSKGEERGLFGEPRRAELEKAFTRNRVDLLREDALVLLKYLEKEKAPERTGGIFRNSWETSHIFRRILEEECPRSVKDEKVTSGEIAAWGVLEMSEGFSLARHGLNRRLGLEFARHLELEVSSEEVEREALRFRRRRSITTPESLEEWLRRNHLDEAEFRRLMKEEALLGRLRHWFVTVEHFGTPVQSLLDVLCLEGLYETCAQGAGEQKTMLRLLKEDLRGEATVPGRAEEYLTSFMKEGTPSSLDRNFTAWCEEMGLGTGSVLRQIFARERLRRRLGGIFSDDPRKA